MKEGTHEVKKQLLSGQKTEGNRISFKIHSAYSCKHSDTVAFSHPSFLFFPQRFQPAEMGYATFLN